jgi:vancomycin aglycone glucosyltransferase
MKIAIVAGGTRGDIVPMHTLARALKAAGHQVRFIATPDFEAPVRADGTEFVPMGPPMRDAVQAVSRARGGRHRALFRGMARYHRLTMRSQFQVLPEATSDVDRIIACGWVYAAASMAELHRVPFRYTVYTPAFMPSARHTPWVVPGTFRSRGVNRLLWSALGGYLRIAARFDFDRYRKRLGLSPVRDIMRHLLSPRPIVAVDAPLATVPEDCDIPYDQIRCLLPAPGDALPDDLEAFLGEGPPPVLVGFGSMPDPDPAATTRSVLAAVARVGCRALISRGWSELGEVTLPDHVRSIDNVDFQRLFPRCAAVVHHGGSGTTHIAARAGVPQIIVPLDGFDQHYWGSRVRTLGLGPRRIRRGQLNARRLAGALDAVLNEPAYARRARDLGARLDAMGGLEPDLDLVLRPPV